MFAKLIHLLSEGKTYSLQEMSRKLGVSKETLRGYIDYLSEKDLLSQVNFEKEENACAGNCVGCKGCKVCGEKEAFENLPILWEIKRS